MAIQRVATQAGEKQLRDLITAHADKTGSARAGEILDNWQEALERFWQLVPPSEANTSLASPLAEAQDSAGEVQEEHHQQEAAVQEQRELVAAGR